jgi:iron complex transport system permease protein
MNISRLWGIKGSLDNNFKDIALFSAFFILLIIIVIFSLAVGRYSIEPPKLFDILYKKLFNMAPTWSDTVETVLFKVRIPRICAAILVGGSLSAAGASYQGIFKNPMVSPDILGASSGAGLGAVVAILISAGSFEIQLFSFVFGILAVALTYSITIMVAEEDSPLLTLVLTGMVVSSLLSAFISLTKYVADPFSKLPAITFWLMGGLSAVKRQDLLFILIPICISLTPLFLLRWKMNALSFGDEEAQSVGVNVKQVRIIMISCATMLTASAVSVAGMVGWVGLIIPHFARMLVGPNFHRLLPASILVGASFLLFIDDIARSLFAVEIPLGILTSIIGAPLFIYLMVKKRRA